MQNSTRIFIFGEPMISKRLTLFEEYDGKLSTFEFKFSTEKAEFPKIFAETYTKQHFYIEPIEECI